MLQLLLTLRWGGGKGGGRPSDISSLTQIKDPRFVYKDDTGKLMVVVEGTQNVHVRPSVSHAGGTNQKYTCQVCDRFTGDGKAMQQHIHGHGLQSAKEWF